MHDFSLDLADIACVRGDRVLFGRLSARVAPGGCLRLAGPNGCGKSTLLRTIAGLARPFTGRIALSRGGCEIAPEDRRDHAAYLGHRDGVKAALTAREHLRLHAALHGAGPVDITGILDRMGLTPAADLPGRFLSSGQRRRLALARLLVAPAPLWVLDEPAVGLDREGTAVLATLLSEHRERGGLAVLSTHTSIDIVDADQIALTDFAPEPSTGMADA